VIKYLQAPLNAIANPQRTCDLSCQFPSKYGPFSNSDDGVTTITSGRPWVPHNLDQNKGLLFYSQL
jgi:hypothetical protein